MANLVEITEANLRALLAIPYDRKRTRNHGSRRDAEVVVLGEYWDDYLLITSHVADRRRRSGLPDSTVSVGDLPARAVERRCWDYLVVACGHSPALVHTPRLRIVAGEAYCGCLTLMGMAGIAVPPDVSHFIRLHLDDGYDAVQRATAELGIDIYYQTLTHPLDLILSLGL